MTINDVKLIMTCSACPEQYDAIDKYGNMLGYLRLRHGTFTVECPDTGGEQVYEASTIGDGIFDDTERDMHLNTAVDCIVRYWNKHPKKKRITREPDFEL